MSENQGPFTKEEEEAKRAKALARDPAARWRMIQEMITWCEANMPPEKRRNRPRLPHQK
jgi:hypothetical protein